MEPRFKQLKVWQKAKDLAVHMYRITDKGKISKEFSLRDQMRRAAVSVASNIAEGDERETDKESIRFFYIARASSAELMTQSIIAHEAGYFDVETVRFIESEAASISKMLYRLIKARS